MNKYAHGKTLLSWYKYQLVEHGESVKYFNRDFLAKYLHAYAKAKAAAENGTSDFYTDEHGILRNAAYNEVFKTDFYNKNSTAYCAFLEIHEKTLEYNRRLDIVLSR